MEKLKELLEKLDACHQAKEWAEGKTIEEVWATCHRGDWMLWLFRRTNPDDTRLLMLAKGHCANTVRHLMKDERSTKAVDAAIAFGNGEINQEELKAAYVAAIHIINRFTVKYSAAAAAAAAAAATVNDSCAVASFAADASFAHARKNNQMLTADICRQYLPCPKI